MSEYSNWQKKMRSLSDKISFDDLCKLFGVDITDDYFDHLFEYSDNFSCDISDCMHEDDNTCPGRKAEQEALYEAMNKYRSAVIEVAQKLFGEHDLSLDEMTSSTFKIVPKTSWRVSADHIRQTINGVGYFGFASVKEFCASGPYTPRSAVLSHLGWISDWPVVYGDGTAKSMIERRMR